MIPVNYSDYTWLACQLYFLIKNTDAGQGTIEKVHHDRQLGNRYACNAGFQTNQVMRSDESLRKNDECEKILRNNKLTS
jgi:hypothetical protein